MVGGGWWVVGGGRWAVSGGVDIGRRTEAVGVCFCCCCMYLERFDTSKRHYPTPRYVVDIGNYRKSPQYLVNSPTNH